MWYLIKLKENIKQKKLKKIKFYVKLLMKQNIKLGEKYVRIKKRRNIKYSKA